MADAEVVMWNKSHGGEGKCPCRRVVWMDGWTHRWTRNDKCSSLRVLEFCWSPSSLAGIASWWQQHWGKWQENETTRRRNVCDCSVLLLLLQLPSLASAETFCGRWWPCSSCRLLLAAVRPFRLPVSWEAYLKRNQRKFKPEERRSRGRGQQIRKEKHTTNEEEEEDEDEEREEEVLLKAKWDLPHLNQLRTWATKEGFPDHTYHLKEEFLENVKIRWNPCGFMEKEGSAVNRTRRPIRRCCWMNGV